MARIISYISNPHPPKDGSLSELFSPKYLHYVYEHRQFYPACQNNELSKECHYLVRTLMNRYTNISCLLDYLPTQQFVSIVPWWALGMPNTGKPDHLDGLPIEGQLFTGRNHLSKNIDSSLRVSLGQCLHMF